MQRQRDNIHTITLAEGGIHLTGFDAENMEGKEITIKWLPTNRLLVEHGHTLTVLPHVICQIRNGFARVKLPDSIQQAFQGKTSITFLPYLIQGQTGECETQYYQTDDLM